MSIQNDAQCNYLKGKSCTAVTEGAARNVREESCSNEQRNLCCCLCASQASCEISCNLLDKSENAALEAISTSTNIDQEIAKSQERIENLASLYAGGKIGEQSYLATAKALENRLDNLRKIKENPSISLPASESRPSRFEESELPLTQRPTSLWYLVPFFFGILGGIVGYVAVKDEDKEMANSLLAFGILWSIILAAFYWIFVMSLISNLLR